MTARPLASWPLWKLSLVVLFPDQCRAIVGEAWLELHDRSHDAARAASNNDGGPWLVAQPRGWQ